MSRAPSSVADAVRAFLRRQRPAPVASNAHQIGQGFGMSFGGGGGGGGGYVISIGGGGVVAPIDELDEEFSGGTLGEWWLQAKGTWIINAGELECTGITGLASTKAQLVATGMGQFADGWAQVRPVANLQSGVLARWDYAAATGYALFRTTTTNVQLRYILTGITGATLGNQAIVAGNAVGIQCVGDQISIVVNGVVATTFTNALATDGYWGIHAATVGSKLDDFYAIKL